MCDTSQIACLGDSWPLLLCGFPELGQDMKQNSRPKRGFRITSREGMRISGDRLPEDTLPQARNAGSRPHLRIPSDRDRDSGVIVISRS
jgi:hypothetical protein